MAEKFIFEFNEKGLDQIIAKVENFRAQLRESGTAELGTGFERFFNEFGAGADRSAERITLLRQQIEALKQAQQSLQGDTRRDRPIRELPNFVQEQLSAAGVTDKDVTVKAAAQERLNALLAEQAQLEAFAANQQQRYVEAKQREANLAALTNRLEQQRVGLVGQLEALKPGGGRLSELVIQRENNLLERQRELRSQLAEEQARFRSAVPKEGAAIFQKELTLSVQVAQARKRVAEAEREVTAARRASRNAALDVATRSVGKGTTEEERTALTEREIQLRQRLKNAIQEEQDANVALNLQQQERLRNAESLASIEAAGGATVGATEILKRLQQINDAYSELIVNSETALDGLMPPGFREELEQVLGTLKSFEGQNIIDPEEQQKLATATFRARELINEFERIPKKGIPLRLNDDELFQGLSFLNRALLGAAQDFGRRFTATLQFAISGALLFGTQKLLREFFDAAVEVERTFADISTSFQFDIEFAQGTAGFEKALEGVRRQTLQIADDFNALPTEVNAAAFQMISRFQDTEAAMAATRAQILATRIATISQEEALRSLTAVAETYGLALAGIADEQERQRAQAKLYGDALDYATAIQQQFGISVEDTLEGAAGLAELFKSLGFSIEETFAVVATTVKQTGQTGQTVTDRLGRAFSQFTSAEVRDELLELANSYDNFFLTHGDFYDSGKVALERIIDQYATLDADLQNKISQIIGQRRETSFVQAFLGAASTGLTDEIETVLEGASGAAEDRLGTLLATVQGTIEGISTEFQSLAQNLQQLGIITPIELLLGGFELVLSAVNSIITKVLDLVEVLNNIRIPFFDKGLGDALVQMLALVSAALSFKSLLGGIQLVVARSEGLKAFFGGSRLVGAGASALGLTGFMTDLRNVDGLFAKVGATMRTAFMAPLALMTGVFTRMKVQLALWHAALIGGSGATIGATIAENGLTVARLRSAITTGFLALKEALAGGLVPLLRQAGAAIARFIPGLARMPGMLLGTVGAITAVTGAASILISFAKSLGDEGTITGTVDERQKQLQEEAKAAGQELTDTEARLQAVTESLDQLNQELPKANDNFQNFILQALGVIPGINVAEIQPGSEFHILRERARATLEASLLEILGIQEDLDAANRALGRGGTSGSLSPQLAPIQERIDEIKATLAQFDVDDPTIGSDLLRLDILNDEIDAQRELIPGVRDTFDDIADMLHEWAEVLTVGQIRDALQGIGTALQLGDITLEEARAEINELRSAAIAGLRNAEKAGNQEDIAEYTRALEEVRLNDLRLFEEEFQSREDLLSGITDNRVRLKRSLELLRAKAREAANNPSFGPGIERGILEDIKQLEAEYAQALYDEAVDRAQFDVDRARTFAARMEAYQRLIQIIRAQIAANLVMNAVFGGLQGISAADEARLTGIMQAMADERLRYAILVARNSTLQNASALDEIAAIAANVNALRAEIEFMRSRGDDYQEILAKEIELRNALAQQRLAEADRRAAFFRLTAGTGDQIKAAQAELRAAEDRLATIVALGGEETQQGYEAELAVLQARHALVQIALRFSDLSRRVGSDITDGYAQALLDVHAAQEALNQATGDLEKLEAEKSLAEAESRAQREFYDQRISDLDFLFQTDQIGRSQYIAGLRALQAGVDRTTRQGEELWRQIEIQIRGIMDSANQAFNIPTEIRLPTLFEVRRALAADALGVNYQDLRTQEINVFVSDDVDVNAVIAALESSFGGSIDLEAARLSSGAAGITIGGFN